MHIGLHVKCPFLFFSFNETWIFSIDFRKILKYQISWNHPVGAELLHTDRQDEANSQF